MAPIVAIPKQARVRSLELGRRDCGHHIREGKKIVDGSRSLRVFISICKELFLITVKKFILIPHPMFFENNFFTLHFDAKNP